MIGSLHAGLMQSTGRTAPVLVVKGFRLGLNTGDEKKHKLSNSCYDCNKQQQFRLKRCVPLIYASSRFQPFRKTVDMR
jgi:hypothetical protein